LEAALLRHGAVLMTGARVTSAADVVAIRSAMGAPVAECVDRFAPRRDHGDGAYSWPEWAADREMCWHHEQSQGARFPGLLALGCLKAPSKGGAMVLSDTRKVLERLPKELLDGFRTQGWRLHRNYRPYLGLSWTGAFGVGEPEEAEKLFAAERIDFAWDGSALHTEQARPAVATHPVTGQECWFNDVAFFNQWSVAEAERGVLMSAFGPRGFPANTFVGDGAELEQSEFDAIFDAYSHVTARVVLRPGDVLFIDNILTAHGREPFVGEWDVVVAMGSEVRVSSGALRI
jgi:alpha-ketoglutarate-dependent taurine dioxygenase